jgi:ATP-dependent exoDNAse (exonuclease V) beta subunit
MSQLADEAARHAIRSVLDRTLVVEAAAGTGKTTELVRRILSLICTGTTTLARIVAVTFTEKAAAEMKLRLRAEIERRRQASRTTSTERERLDTALAELEVAHISTIHAFCAELLREWPVESGVDPMFETADEDRQERLYDEAFERWFQRALADPPEGIRRVLRRKAEDKGGARESLRRAGLAVVDQRDFDGPWRRDPFDRDAAIDAVIPTLAALGALAQQATNEKSYATQSIAEVERFVAELARRESLRPRDHDGLEAELRVFARGKFWKWKASGKYFGKDLLRTDVLAQRDAAKQRLDELLERADADLAACLRRDLQSLVRAYETTKGRVGVLDFLDLLLLARDLVRDHAEVRRELQARFSHFLVDEFQDTDPLQAEILLLLAANDPAEADFSRATPVPGKLFAVGDPKQAIYRFRRADVTLYESIKRRLIATGADQVNLTTSFRSTPSIQDAINAAFSGQMRGSPDGSQAQYVALSPFRNEPLDQPTIIALPVPRPYSDWGKITNYAIDASLPDAVAAFVDWLLNESGWRVTERDSPSERVPVAARQVCLLSRRFSSFRSDVTRPYVRALEARRIPHVLVGGRSFHDREEIIAIRSALNAIEWPEDELSVFATLRGPFMALGDDALLAFRAARGNLHPLKPIELGDLDELTRPVGEALQLLRTLHLRRNRRPVAETIAHLLEATRAHAGIAIWPSGEQALANLLRVLDRARRFEANGAISFRAFVRKLDEEAERGDAEEAPIVEEGTDGVRIMTVHKAKGLEFPIVILVDPTCPLIHQEPSRYVDPKASLWAMPLAGCIPTELVEHRDEVLRHDSAEAVRLSYVAATRARDLLVIPVVGDAASPSSAALPSEPMWLSVFDAILYPPSRDRRRCEVAPGCPAFQDDSVSHRPNAVQATAEASVKPGGHKPLLGQHSVVWWDPNVLHLDRQEDAGLRHQRVLSPDPSGAAVAAGEQAHEAWRRRGERVRREGAVPSVLVRTVTELKSSEDVGPLQVRTESTDVNRAKRPHGKRFGTLVHAVLAIVDLKADEAAVRGVVNSQGRVLGADVEEIAAAIEAVIGALRHPLLQRAAAAEDCRREVPIVFARPNGELVEGIVDLAFSGIRGDAPAWTVVDFKTDVELGVRRTGYETQVALYTRAIASATNQPAEGVLFIV